ncbi:unnamed protein product [Prunus armeniaca]|uniref:Uncharacterized protein n=1 Tax=Prunus armeniaca TaxID=36596 RepID=A0A6J5U405_PRUAR|nr:unnamed protein product [Prunus armeniaca]
MLKYAWRLYLLKSSVITGYYFIWSTSSVAIFLACLGLTVLPVNVLLEATSATCLKKGGPFKCKLITPISSHVIEAFSGTTMADCFSTEAGP